MDGTGEVIGGIVIFLEDDQLSLLEIYDYLDTPGISPLPPLEQLQYNR